MDVGDKMGDDEDIDDEFAGKTRIEIIEEAMDELEHQPDSCFNEKDNDEQFKQSRADASLRLKKVQPPPSSE